RQRVIGKRHLAANGAGLRKHARVRHLAANAERNQGHRMRMHDRANVGARTVNGSMKWELRRRRVGAMSCAILLYANNVPSSQTPLVDSRRRNPNVPVRLTDREIATRSRRHPVTI